jgi:hypothetical protein
MRNGRPARWLFFSVTLVAATSGCQAFYQYTPVGIRVRDAETREPIPGAEVHISYPLSSSAYAPYDSTGTTDGEGIARLRAASYSDAGILVEVNAQGYMYEDKNLSVEQFRSRDPVSPTGSGRTPNVSVVDVELYAEPRPSMELVVPNGYHGLVRAEVHVQDDAPCPPRQRVFSYVVPLAGVVQVRGPHLLRRVTAADFCARYVDGTPLPRESKDWDVGFHPLVADEGVYTFVVGTKFEFDDYRREYRKDAAEPRRSGQGGKSGGKGGRKGRKGDAPAGDAPASDASAGDSGT